VQEQIYNNKGTQKR